MILKVKFIKRSQIATQHVIKIMMRSLMRLYLLCNRRSHIYCENIFDGRNAIIFCNGVVSCTCGDNTMECKMGNIKDNSIREIWLGKGFQRARQSFRKNKIPFIMCINCGALKIIAKDSLVFNEIDFPYNINFETTAFCNLRCYICRREQIAEDRNGKMILDPHNVYRVLNEIISYEKHVKTINWFGLGEPFMDKNLISYINKIKTASPRIIHYISTNGLLLEEKTIQELLKVGVDKITFSIDGASSETYIKYQIGGDFKKALFNMKNLVKLRNSMGYRSPFIRWQYILFKWNDGKIEIEKAKELAKDIGVDELLFQATFSPLFCVSRKYPPFARAKLKKLNEETVKYLKG